MTEASIVKIPVDASDFEKFTEVWNQYQAQLKAQPAAWGATNARIVEFARLQQAAGVTADKAWANATKAAHSYEAAVKGVAKAQTGLGSGIHRSVTAMRTMAKEAKTVSGYMLTAVRFATKLGGMIGLGAGLIGGGLTLGLDELANGVLERQRTARGLGLTVGQLRSWNVNMARYASQGVLQGAAEAQVNPAQAGWLATAGIPWQQAHSESATALAEQEIMAAHRAWRANPSVYNPQVMALQHLGMSLADIRTAGAESGANLRQAFNATNSNAGAFGLSDQAQREWSQFAIQLRRAGVLIETALINTLTPLTPQLSKLSGEFANMIGGLEKSGKVKEWVGDVAGGLKTAAQWLGSPAFRADMRTIAYDFSVMAKKLEWLFGPPRTPETPGTNNPGNIMKDGKLRSFDNEAQGVQAMVITEARYGDKMTAAQAFAKYKGPWGGKGDATTKQYVQFIAQHAGIDPTKPLPFGDAQKMAAVIHWQTVAEGNPVPEKTVLADLEDLYRRAGVLPQPKVNPTMAAPYPIPGIGKPDSDIASVRARHLQTQPNQKITIENNTAAQAFSSANAAAW